MPIEEKREKAARKKEKAKKTFLVPVVWEMYGRVEVEANSPKEAYKKVKNNPENFNLPEGSYVDESFEAAYDDDENVYEL